ncbi:hypothetical protein GARC_2702 [Paraglaciecola arctica BSs20135]|uniref:Uncharacterized protein n=1 Tax=Paraglaciecola arctica BSs20135 TaxID=493475 RepID=K6YNA3_9ALTE|nr:hypothetical protein GARC_2702 [Paraglaciecola arctica BSs20135]
MIFQYFLQIIAKYADFKVFVPSLKVLLSCRITGYFEIALDLNQVVE